MDIVSTRISFDALTPTSPVYWHTHESIFWYKLNVLYDSRKVYSCSVNKVFFINGHNSCYTNYTVINQ